MHQGIFGIAERDHNETSISKYITQALNPSEKQKQALNLDSMGNHDAHTITLIC